MRNCKQEKAREIFDQLYNRRLFKMISEIRFRDERDAMVRTKLREVVANPDRKRQCEEKIASYIGIDPDFVIVNKPPIRDLNYVSQTESPNLEAIMIFDVKQKLFLSLPEYAGELFFVRHSADTSALETIQVYAPYQTTLEEKIEIQNVLRSS